MRVFAIIPLLFVASVVLGQNKLPVVKASSKKAIIMEGPDKFNWSINPEAKPDVHLITKSVKSKLVKFYTDTDSIKVKLKPGQVFEFIVLLNNTDTCYTRLESPSLKNYATQTPITHDTIPFTLTEFNNIKVKAIVNGVDTLKLKFDSGTTGLLLTNDAIKQKMHVVNNAKSNNTLQIGNQKWAGLEVFPVAFSGQGTDGRFGWDLFDGKVVEIDYDKNLFIVHSRLPMAIGQYTKLAIDYTHTVFCIQGRLQIKDKQYANRFLFDTGYQRTIMLDTMLMAEQNYPKGLQVIKRVVMHDGQGREVPVITVNNERLNLGGATLFNIPVQLMTMANPARFKTHILGNEVLKRFNTLLDFRGNFVYLKANTLFNLPYKDAM